MLKLAFFSGALLIVSAFAASPFAAADTSSLNAPSLSATSSEANIHSGNWVVDAGLSLTRDSGKRINDSNEFDFSTKTQYFLLDRFALGLKFGLEIKSDVDTISTLGPVASFYFWNDGKFAAYTGVELRFGLTDYSIDTIFGVELGAQYFITPAVAVGPAVYWRNYGGEYLEYQRYGTMVGFGIYL